MQLIKFLFIYDAYLPSESVHLVCVCVSSWRTHHCVFVFMNAYMQQKQETLTV